MYISVQSEESHLSHNELGFAYIYTVPLYIMKYSSNKLINNLMYKNKIG